MGYTLTQINTILSKADRAIHILGSVAYNKKFAELDETYWYDRDIIFLYKYAVEWGKVNDRVGTARMDSVVERLEAMMEIYDYGSLTPIYSQVAQVTGINTVNFLTEETDPTVPAWVKLITESDIDNWDESYTDRINSLTTIGSSGTATLINNILNIPNYGSALSAYVPYTGATGDVNLGVYTLNANSINIIGPGIGGNGGGYLGLKQSASVIYGGGGYTSLNGEDKIYLTMYFSQDLTGTNYKLAKFNVSALTNNTPRIYSLPNTSGTLALTSDITNLTFSSPLVNTAGVVSIPAATSSVNGYLSSADWTTFNNKQAAGNYVTLDTYQTITASKTFSVGFNLASVGGTNQPTFFENTNNLHSGSVGSNIFGFNTANNIYFGKGSDNGGVLSWNNSEVRYYTLPNANGTLALTSQLTSGTVTSVAASITGNAIGITGSPITSSGTLAFAFAGNATQYVRGDGALATLPTNGGGGGASVSYYLNGSINQGTIGGVTYYEMNKTPIIGAGTDFTRNSNGYIASFLTDANDPALLNIPAGNFNFETYFQASSGGGSPTFYIELYKYDGTTFTLIASNSGSPKLINDGTNIEAYFSALAVPQTTLTLTDRLAIRIYVTTAGRTITLHTENGHLCQVITTFTTGLTALNGLTAQVQYLATGTSGTDFNISSATATHTFNLPTASATNRGALSSADWTTFNSKQNALTNPITGTGTSGQVAYFNGTSSLTSSATFAFTPTSQLLVNNSVTAASAIARGTNLTPTLTAAANNDVLVGLDINPTFTLGAFTTTSSIGIRSQVASAAGKWNIYASGTASNYFNGNVILGTTTDNGTDKLQVTGSVKVTSTIASTSNFVAFLDGSNTVGSGARITLSNTAGTRYINQQLDASNGLLISSYDGTTLKNLVNLKSAGNFLIGSTTDNGTDKLQVTGTGIFQLNQNANTTLAISNTTAGTASRTEINIFSDASAGAFSFGKYSSTKTAYKLITSSSSYLYNAVAGNISILNDFTSGNINFAAGGSSTAQATLFSTGNFALNTTTDAGFRLDVNGTARVQGAATFTIGASTSNTYLNTIDITQTGNIFPTSSPTMGLSIQGTYTDNNTANNTIYQPFLNVNPTISYGTTNALTGVNRSFINFSPTVSGSGKDLNNNTYVLNISPSFINRIANNITGIYYNPAFTISAQLNNHIAIQTVTGNVLLCTTSGNVAIGTTTLATATELTLGGSQTASSAIARGGLINTTLVAAANNDVLVGLDINPTFTNGAFTGLQNWGIRLFNSIRFQTDSDLGQGLYWKPSNDGTTLRIFGSNHSAGVGYQQLNVLSGGDGLVISGATRITTINAAQSSIVLNLNNIIFNTHGTGEAARIVVSSKNFLIGTTTDAGFRLDVNGTARVQGALTISTGGFSVTGNSTLTGDLSMPGYGIDNLSRVNITNAPNGGGLTIRGTLATNTLAINFQESTTNVSQINWDNSNNYLQLRTIKANSVINFTVTGNTISTISSTGVSINGNLITGGTSVNASAQLQVDSTTKGFLPPRQNQTQRNAIASPAEGLIVYQTDGVAGLYVYSGGSWKSLTMTTI
jgi:hypothetical protein